MRCSVDGVSMLARSPLGGDPLLGHLLIVRNLGGD